MSDNELQYFTGQLRPGTAALIAEFELESSEASRFEGAELDVRYGAHPRQRFDLFPAPAPAWGTLLYFHGGYWQARDKQTFRFIGPALAARGLQVAVVNYPLCPEVRLAELIDAAAAVLPAIRTRVGRGHPLILAGHSAGAHISAELAMRLKHEEIGGVLAISGVFDLEPLVGTSINARLRLDGGQARLASPIHRVCPGLPPAIFTVGSTETEAFQEQSHRMASAWSAAGNSASEIVIPGADHFTILRALTDPEGELQRGLFSLCRQGARPLPR